MTPEQENELVARWMGWEYWESGTADYPDGSTAFVPEHWRRENARWTTCPQYRTDPALLWELQVRLVRREHGWWVFNQNPACDGYTAIALTQQQRDFATLAEAVFAAAVVQAQYDKAEQEGK